MIALWEVPVIRHSVVYLLPFYNLFYTCLYSTFKL